MRARYLALAPILALALLPNVPAGAAKVETCLGQKATYVGTNKRDFVALGGANNVAVMKGGNDTVHVFKATDKPVYLCLGDGTDDVYGDPWRVLGDKGEDSVFFQPVCGNSPPLGRPHEPTAFGNAKFHDVEHVEIFGCSETLR
jgi:hypothetical protein